VVSGTPRPHFTPGKDPVPILQEAGWAPGPVWTSEKSHPHRDSIPDRPDRSQFLYRIVTSTAVNKHHKASPSSKYISQTKFKIYVKLNSAIYRAVTLDMNITNSVPRQTPQWKALWRKNHVKFNLQNFTKIIQCLRVSGDGMTS